MSIDRPTPPEMLAATGPLSEKPQGFLGRFNPWGSRESASVVNYSTLYPSA
jgi:hypothetical protein